MSPASGRPPARRASAGRADARHRGREAAVQMLYQWEVGGTAPDDVIETYWAARESDPPAQSREFANALVRGTVARLADIDPLIEAGADHWRLSRMAVLDRLILRLAVFEFLNGGDVPARVAISEALELARTFSTEDAVRFINGVLDGIRKRLEGGPSR
ncbi:MAG: transcription antitermination factor NusB [Acidobacteria bacterium]|nr:transcription antitermination factor NusB [Acidobacteriota bacterium]